MIDLHRGICPVLRQREYCLELQTYYQLFCLCRHLDKTELIGD